MNNPFTDAGKVYYPGSSMEGKIYQDMSFLGYKHSAHRKNIPDRINHISKHIDLKDKNILDMGCSNGAMSLGFAINGAARVTGVDIDTQSIAIANKVSQEKNINNVNFISLNLTDSLFTDLVADGKYDVVLWLSQFMWLWRYEGWDEAIRVLRLVSDSIPIMLFETAQAPKDGAVGAEYAFNGTSDVKNFLLRESSYDSVTDIGYVSGWSKRHVLMAQRK